MTASSLGRGLVSRAVLGLLLAACVWPISARADFTGDYIKGQKALRSGDLAEAAELLRAAIAEKPEAEEKVRLYGMRFDPYVPHFFLGQALLEAGDCEGALASFQQSMDFGVVQGLDEYAELQAGMEACQSQVIDLTPFLAEANSALDRLERANQSFAELADTRLLQQEWGDRWQPELERSGAALRELRSRLAAAENGTDVAAVEAVTAEARNSAGRIDGSRDLAEARVTSLREEQARLSVQQREQVSRGLGQAVAAARSVSLPQNGSGEMRALHQQLVAAIATGESMGADASVPQLRDASQSINGLVRRYQEAEQDWRVEQQAIASRTPPPLLKQVAEAYFNGDYPQTYQLADPAELQDERARVQLYLFRAAASYKLFVLSGEENQEHLRNAEADIRAIKSLNGQFAPYISAFSPRFLDFFRRTG